MPRRSTRTPSGPSIAEIVFNEAKIKATLVAYAESRGGALPNGPVKLDLFAGSTKQDRARIEIIHQVP